MYIYRKLNLYKNKIYNLLRKLSFTYFYPDKDDYYKYLTHDQLIKEKSSNKLFVFGSGYSLNEIPAKEYESINRFDTLGYNQIFKQDFVDLTFYLFREVGPHKGVAQVNDTLEDFRMNIKRQRFANTVYLLQDDLTAKMSIEAETRFLMPKGSRLAKYKTYSGKLVPPPENLRDGLVHFGTTLADSLCFGYQMGYEEVVLCGVDLYDRRYFFLNDEETHLTDKGRGESKDSKHSTSNPVTSLVETWLHIFQKKGIKISVHNPKSLLTKILPVFDKNYSN